MQFQQVALTVMAFSSARGGSIEHALSPSQQVSVILPPPSLSRIVVEEDNQAPGTWGVRVVGGSGKRRTLLPPVYLPQVDSEAGLRNALAQAWDIHIQSQHRPAPFITRFLEPPRTPPQSENEQDLGEDAAWVRTPPRIASLHRRQRGVSPQMLPRPL